MQIDGLDHIGIAVADRSAAERFYGDTLGLERDDAGRFRIGRTAFELLDLETLRAADRAARQGIHHLALAVADLDRAALAASQSGLLTPGGAARQPPTWLDRAATLGVRFCLVERSGSEGRSWTGADGLIERVDHIGVASADNAAAHHVFGGLLGLPVESTQTDTEVRIPAEFFVSDKYGVALTTRPALAVGGLRVSFFSVGDCELEVLQDFDPATAAGQASEVEGSTRRDQSAITRFVRTRGPGAHHVALKVGEVGATLRRLEAAGVELIDRVGRPGSRRARIAFLHPASTRGVLFHLVEREALV